nr:MAG TPA: hypothetical protein [Caudoviricetes sp.]
MSEKIIAYKAMDKNMQCRGKQYEVGKTYYEDEADCCRAGMHACENPLDVLRYYKPDGKSRFFEVECSGDISREDGKDSKLACTELKVTGEINLAKILKLGAEATIKRVNKKIEEAKDKSKTAAGDYSRAEALGEDSIAVANGEHSKALGAMGCYLVLTEYDNDGSMICAKMSQVDGKTIKENVWYTLKNGEFVEAEP